MTLPETAQVLELPPRRSLARAAWVALRPRQWTKNLLLFAGIVFAAELGDGWRWLDALEESDDVQEVYSNFDIPERVMEAVAT